MPLRIPLNVVDAEDPTVSVFPCRFTSPLPARLPISSEFASLRVPAAPTTTAPALAIAALPDRVSIPPLTVVVPEKVFVPPSVNWPSPALLMPKAPLTTPFIETALSTLSCTLDARATAPAIVNVPVFATSPKLSVPESCIPLFQLRAVVLSAEMRPPVMNTVPTPNAWVLPTRIVPLLSVTPEVNVFAPESVSAPLPFFTSDPPVPMIPPLKTVELPPAIVNALFCKFRIPAPSTPPTTSALESFSDPDAFTVTTEASDNAFPPESVSVPAFTVVSPLYVFAAVKINSSAPALTKL